MKTNFLKFGFFAIIFSMTLFATSCGGHDHDHDGDGHEQHEGQDADADGTSDADTPDKTSKEYASAYICPMHCEGSGSDAEGKCPVCGMDYVKNEDHNEDGHDH